MLKYKCAQTMHKNMGNEHVICIQCQFEKRVNSAKAEKLQSQQHNMAGPKAHGLMKSGGGGGGGGVKPLKLH